jgi:soluble lytic murein transglycosylase-like protein
MKRMPILCSLLIAIGACYGQGVQNQNVQEVSRRWVRYYANVYRLPVELVEAIIDEESRWNPYAVSNKGAAGLMQLMPRTAIRFGVRNRFRVEENIKGGVAYLAWLRDTFKGDLRLVTAAYYVGEGPILPRGLNYSSPDVHGYVTRVAKRYRTRRAQKARAKAQEEAEYASP